MQHLRLEYKNSPVQIDIFPYEKYYKKISEDEKNNLRNKITECYDKFYETFDLEKMKTGEIRFPIKELLQMQNEIVMENHNGVEGTTIFQGCEYEVYEKAVYDWEDIFPLKTGIFEGIELLIPNKPELYLTKIYGDYLKLPPKIACHSNIKEKISKFPYISETLNELKALNIEAEDILKNE